ncbi:hypothetical protein [Nitrosopumilus cobalaminigenes]|uniref:hypothetical protein n=1 Tax=Nitrosopumilus cobalaminigenes TaxID=1470066 RepID=UPI0015CC1F34|nr:hypothetical protein [Nitrosopumilus cobalaminigenes]
MESNFSFGKLGIKNIFKKDTKFTNKCKICGLTFSAPERTKIHMMKAHSKPKREK